MSFIPAITDFVQDWLLDNPFFVRGCRQSRRTLRAAAQSSVVGFGMLLALLMLVWLAPGALRRDLAQFPVLPALWLCGIHALLCAGVGTPARGTLAGEIRFGTFQLLLLLPYPPWQLLALKLVYPAWWLLVLWLAGCPFYFAAALLDLAPASLLGAVAPIPLLIGMVSIGAEQLDMTSFRRLQREVTGGSAREPIRAGDALGSLLVVWGLILAGGRELLTSASGGWSASRGLYGLPVPRWAYWALLLGVVGVAAFTTALSGISTQEAASARAGRVRRTANGLFYLLLVGSAWGLLRDWQRVVLLLGVPIGLPVLLVLFRWMIPPRREDRLSAAEVAWIARRWDNPLLLRDLRGATRYVSMRRSCVRRTLVVAGMVGALAGVILGTGSGPFVPWEHLVFGIGLSAAGFLLYYPTTEAAMAWATERPGAAALMLLAPTSTAELLRGRALAAVIHCWLVNAALWLLLAAMVGWALWQGRWTTLVALGAMSPLIFPFLAASWGLPDAVGAGARENTAVVVLLALGTAGTTLAFKAASLPPVMVLLLSLLLFSATWAQGRGYYRLRLERVERFRREHLELLDAPKGEGK
jgi:hypothetical protein